MLNRRSIHQRISFLHLLLQLTIFITLMLFYFETMLSYIYDLFVGILNLTASQGTKDIIKDLPLFSGLLRDISLTIDHDMWKSYIEANPTIGYQVMIMVAVSSFFSMGIMLIAGSVFASFIGINLCIFLNSDKKEAKSCMRAVHSN